MAIRFLLGNRCKIGTLYGERIAAPVCGLVRNDREIGHWFLKLMTLPRRERLWCSETDMHIRFIVNSFQTDKKQSLHQIRCRDCFYSSLDFSTMPQIMSTHCSMPRVLVSRQMS